MSELHIFVSAVHCSCHNSKPCRVCERLISQHKFIITLFMCYSTTSGLPRNFFRGWGVQQIQLRTEDRGNGDLGAVAP